MVGARKRFSWWWEVLEFGRRRKEGGGRKEKEEGRKVPEVVEHGSQIGMLSRANSWQRPCAGNHSVGTPTSANPYTQSREVTRTCW